jgi:hypothetical protein
MSLAWSSLVIVVLLLPGLLFFAGIYLPEQFTRETENRSPLGHLGGALLISFIVHGTAFAAAPWVCGGLIPCIDAGLVLNTITYDPRGGTGVEAIAENLQRYRWWILVYVLASATVGMMLGGLYGHLAVRGKTGGLSRHSWIRDLRVNGLTYCHVLTTLRQDERILLYRGFLRAFGLQADGRFSYIVLTDVCREYLLLDADSSKATSRAQDKVMGTNSPPKVRQSPPSTTASSHAVSLFVVDGQEIANVVFDIYELQDHGNGESVATIAKEEGELLKYTVSKALLDAISSAPSSAFPFPLTRSFLSSLLRRLLRKDGH